MLARAAVAAVACAIFASLPAATLAASDSGDDFVTVWGVTADDPAITIPVGGATGTYTVHWGDGTVSADVSGDQTHTYGSEGEYTVRISGDFTRIKLGDDPANAQKLRSIEQWGDMQWSSMESAFRGAVVMTYNATDSPDLSGVSDMSHMFATASKFNGNLSQWDTSSVTVMDHMFYNSPSFNGDVSTWDVSRVTDMHAMFYYAHAFNGDISAWDVSRVTDMDHMFDRAHAFNGDISEWDVSRVTDMGYLFHRAFSFNGDISAWDVSRVTDMHYMFRDSSFNGDISAWDVSRVANMYRMFHSASFNGDISAWDVSRVTNMGEMFYNAPHFDGDISGWDVSRVTGMGHMFTGADSFTRNLGPWYITLDRAIIHENGTYTASIAAQNDELRGHGPSYHLADNDTHADNADFAISGNVLTMTSAPTKAAYSISVGAESPHLFGADSTRQLRIIAPHLNSPPGADAGQDQTVSEGSAVQLDGSASSDPDGNAMSYSWAIVSPAGGAAAALQGADTMAPSFTAPGVYADTNYTIALTVSDGITVDTDTVTITVRDTDPLNPEPSASKYGDDFVTTWRVTGDDLTITIPVGGATGTYGIDWGDSTSSVDVSGDQSHTYGSEGEYTVRISGDFTRIKLGDDPANAQKLLSIEQWGGMQWSSMESAFRDAGSMTYNATDSPDLSGVSDMSRMFTAASKFTGDLSGWDVSGVTDMSNMFFGADSFDGDISAWDVSGVTDMSGMFYSAPAFDGDISAWDVSGVTDMSGMFYRASAFDGNISAWDVSDVTDMSSMFEGASSFDGDISAWDTSSVTDMSGMFTMAYYFNSDISAWDVSNARSMDWMFWGASSFDQNLGPWYVTLNVTRIHDDSYAAEVAAQNSFLSGRHNPSYSLADGDGCADNGKFAISSDGVLTIKSAPAQETYSICIGASGGKLFGADNSRRIILSTNTPPAADAGPDQTVPEGAAVQLDGSASSDPDGDTMSYRWVATSPDAILRGADTRAPSFTAPQVSGDTDYAFKLIVTDGSVTDTDTVVITVQDAHPAPPAAPKNLRAASASADSATLAWDDPGDDAVTGYKILSRILAPQHSLGVLVADTGSAASSYTVTGLEPNTKYAFRIIALSDHGESDTSYFVNVRTERAPPPAAPTNLTATAVTTDSVTLSWDGAGDDAVTGYKILSRILAPQHSLGVLVADTGSAASSYTVTGLEPNTKYAFRIIALSDHGESDTSYFVNVRTERAPPPAAPTNLTATAVTTDSVTLSWDGAGDDAVTGYKILSRILAPQHSLGVLVADTGSAASSYTVTGLEPNTKYAFRIIALSDHGESKVSHFVNISTPSGN